MKARFLVPVLWALSACGSNASLSTGAAGEAPEQVAASLLADVVGTAASATANGASGGLRLGASGIPALTVSKAAVSGLCSNGFSKNLACPIAGTAELSSACSVRETGDVYDLNGSVRFHGCGLPSLTGLLRFLMELGPVSPGPIPFALRIESDSSPGDFLAGRERQAVSLAAVLTGRMIGGAATDLILSELDARFGVYLCDVHPEADSATPLADRIRCRGDSDRDGVPDLEDNCPAVSNPSQTDEDANGTGDLCDTVACGDDVCDPEAGECDVLAYCLKDCNRSRCFGLPDGETCGDGRCDALAGECAVSAPCLSDCGDPHLCDPGTCPNSVCEPWEDDPRDLVTFCPSDCACAVNRVEGDCRETADCSDEPGTVCRPERDVEFAESYAEYVDRLLDIACACTTCGNAVFDEGEGCEPSLGWEEGIQPCFDGGGLSCADLTCVCDRPIRCGDTIVQDDRGEECDTGFVFPPEQGSCEDGFICIADQCACSQCGNGGLDGGEQCDTEGEIGPSPDCEAFGPDFICRNDCTCSLCGNGSVDPMEDCDVNSPPGTWGPACSGFDFCPDTCTCGEPPTCGNSSFDPPAEECDDTAGPPMETGADCGPTRCVDPGTTGPLGEAECTCLPP